MPEQDLVTEETLRALMALADVPASPLTVTGLVSGGRRRVRRRRQATAAGVAVLAILVGVLVAAPAGLSRRSVPAGVPTTAVSPAPSVTSTAVSRTCAVSDVAMPDGTTDAELVDISPNGRYYVGHTSVGQDFRPVIWVDGVPHTVAYPASANSADLQVVNSAGVAAGEVDYRQYGYVVRYENGLLHQLRYPAGGPWYLVGELQLSESGTVRAEVEPMSSVGSDGAQFTTLIWYAGEDTPQVVKEPAGVQIVGLSSDGSMIGNKFADHRVYVYDALGQNGRMVPVPDGWSTYAVQVRGDWAVGEIADSAYNASPKAAFDPDRRMAVAWNISTGQTVTLYGGSMGRAVNSAGALVSEAQLLVLDHGQRYQLASPGASFRVFTNGISDDGTVIGYAWDDSTQVTVHRALRWKC